jgi:hypothetical protein
MFLSGQGQRRYAALCPSVVALNLYTLARPTRHSALVFSPELCLNGASHERGTPGEVWLRALWQSH